MRPSGGHGAVPASISILLVSGLALGAAAQTPPPQAKKGEVEAIVTVGGKHYELVHGDVFNVGPDGRRQNFVRHFYDPDYYHNYYDVEGKVIYRVDRATGERYRVITTITEDFEGAKTIRDLIGIKRGWSDLTLLEPRAPTVKAMIAHRQRVIDGKSGFLDNRVEPTNAKAHSGATSLKLIAVPPSAGMIVSKASLDTALLHFISGEDLWFRGWFFIESGNPLGIVDFECSFLEEAPGLRLLFDNEGRPRVELKWAAKPTYRGSDVLPRGRWTKIALNAHLSEKESEGRVRVWFDDKLVVSAKGQTFPIAAAVYDRMQVGVTANPPGSRAVIYLDDVYVGKTPPP